MLQVYLYNCVFPVFVYFLPQGHENWPLENKVPMRGPYAFYPALK